MIFRTLKLSIAGIIVALTGCGYSLQGSGSILPKDVSKIYIPIVENYSTEPGLSSLLTESLGDKFERFGVVQVVDDLGDADAVLKTRLMKVKRTTRTTSGDTDTALQYDSTLTVDSELRRVTGAVLWKNSNITVSKAYGSSQDSVNTGSAEFAQGPISSASLGALDTREVARGQETASLRLLVDEAARIIYDQAVAPDF